MFLRRNVASQAFTIPGSLRATSTGAAVTTGTLYVVKDGVEAAAAGTLTHLREGCFTYTPTQGETDCAIFGGVLTGTSAIPVPFSIRTTAGDPNDSVRLGLTSLPNAAANASGGLYTLGGTGVAVASIATDAITAAAIAADAGTEIGTAVWASATRSLTTLAGLTVDSNLVSILGEAVSTSSDPINANVVQISGDSVAADNLEAACDGTGYNVGAGQIVAASVTSKTGFKLASDGLDAVTVETGLNARQALSVATAAAAGVLAGAASTSITIAAAGVPATNRITATVDADGNRSAVTLNLPA